MQILETRNNTRSKIINYFCILFISIICFIVLYSSFLPQNILFASSLILIDYCFYYKYFGKQNLGYSIFIISFVIFHFGLLILFSLSFNQNNFYLFQFDNNLLNRVVFFQTLCVFSLFFAALYSPYLKPFKYKYFNNISPQTISYFAKVGFYSCLLVETVLLILKWKVFTSSGFDGYASVIDFEGTIPTPLYLMEYFFIPFAFLVILYNKNNNKKYKIIVVVWSIVTALMGDRTSGLGGIVSILLIDIYLGKKLDKKKYFIIIIGFIIVLFLIAFIGYYRIGKSTENLNNPLISVFEELGFNFVPVAFTILLFPQKIAYKLGSTYIFATIAALLPSSFDISGLSKAAYEIGYESAAQTQAYSGFDFGIGYSLCAEAYANFGILGFIVIFLEGLFIIKMLKFNQKNRFSIYVSITLLFQYFTLPRRHYYNLVNHIFWCVIIMTILLYLYIYIIKYSKVNLFK